MKIDDTAYFLVRQFASEQEYYRIINTLKSKGLYDQFIDELKKEEN
jgi:hypothetical protein